MVQKGLITGQPRKNMKQRLFQGKLIKSFKGATTMRILLFLVKTVLNIWSSTFAVTQNVLRAPIETFGHVQWSERVWSPANLERTGSRGFFVFKDRKQRLFQGKLTESFKGAMTWRILLFLVKTVRNIWSSIFAITQNVPRAPIKTHQVTLWRDNKPCSVFKREEFFEVAIHFAAKDT